MAERKIDQLFADYREVTDAFAFDEAVADVFEDMINRSVPGYQTMLGLIGVLAKHYAQPHTRIYDLGSSLGASTLMIARQLVDLPCEIIAIDSSQAMLTRCRENLESLSNDLSVYLKCADIRDIDYTNASLIVSNLTLQFIPQDERDALIARLYAGLKSKGALVLCEKLCFDDAQEQSLMNALYLDYKRANGYSELEISQKRAALDNVLVPETLNQHRQRLESYGFIDIKVWFRALNFVGLLAQKP